MGGYKRGFANLDAAKSMKKSSGPLKPWRGWIADGARAHILVWVMIKVH
jgi:hypothetical protein